MGLIQQAWVEKTVHEVEIHWLHIKVRNVAVGKEGHTDHLRGYEGPVTIDFLEKCTTIISVSYCQLLRPNSPYLLKNPRMHVCIIFCQKSPCTFALEGKTHYYSVNFSTFQFTVIPIQPALPHATSVFPAEIIVIVSCKKAFVIFFP